MRQINQKRLDALKQLTISSLTMPVAAGNQPDTGTFEHWKLVLDEHRVLWAILDKKDHSTNTLSESVLLEMDQMLDIAHAVHPVALVLRSAKTNGFVAGAEISEFVEMKDPIKVRHKIEGGLAIFDKLADFHAPTIALIHGFCLGGGLELALACDYRIATPDSKLGFPEVLLGLHPGLAGTWRSLQLMDPVNAMTAMLTGKNLIAKKAKRQGLLDAVTPERHFAEAVKWVLSGKLKKQNVKGGKAKIMNFSMARDFLAKQMIAKTAKLAPKKHYPAPYALIELWRQYGDDAKSMRKAETDSFVDLMVGDTSKNLVRDFFLREKLKSSAKGFDHGISHVHVIGAGVMGGDIAAWSALRGFNVTLQDRELQYIAPAIKRANELFAKRLYTEGDRRAANDRLMPDIDGIGIANANLIIEVVPENPEIKTAVYADCEARMKDGAILATNTSSLLLEELDKGLKSPENFCGIHFFNPVAKMPLVEVVTHSGLSDKAKNRVMAFVAALDKLPLPVRSAPGFLVNRALTPYLSESFAIYSEGVKPEVIDKAALDFGMPMGPMELADVVGLDVGVHVARVLKAGLKREMPDIPDWLDDLVAKGNLGKKTGKGIYKWIDGKPDKQEITDKAPDDLADRLILPLLNSVADCLADNIVEDKDAADAAMIFGTGFAPFTGGPMKYADDRGIDEIIQRLSEFEKTYGARFKPSKGWK